MPNIPEIVAVEEFLQLAIRLPIIDVRSPGEFAQGHIPGAHNIPLFDNDERARIGTTYVQIGKEQAIDLGQQFAGVKTDYYLNHLSEISVEKTILLHCWRGGMRSAKIALFYSENGYRVFVLEGGYKSYRQFVRSQFSSGRPIFLVGGYTGSGKTHILQKLQSSGQQIIDLEALACHKGSAFGHLGQKKQPSTEQFENDLYAQWAVSELLKPIWVEHESKNIGTIFLPDTFHNAMLNGVLFKINVPIQERIKRLVDEYACFENEILSAVIEHLAIRMGSYQASEARKALKVSDYEQVALISLKYYDKLYDNAMLKRPVKRVIQVDLRGIHEKNYHEVILKKAIEEKLL